MAAQVSPRSSIQHAGAPWELGLAETNQTLYSTIRSRVRLETDGQLKLAATLLLLVCSAPKSLVSHFVTLGCLMMRVCHKNTHPVGVATKP